MTIYGEILEQAGGEAVAAGFIHEKLWERLLRREDPRFHNVRITRGDGGIDGVILKDPVLGRVTVFQAKFFTDLSKKDHRDAVVKAFGKAHGHDFLVVEWKLLLPITVSHQDLNWLYGGGLKKKAVELFGASSEDRIITCGVECYGETHLEDLCSRHLDIVLEVLPKSGLAFAAKLDEERARASYLQLEIVDRLRIINQEQIRQRQVDRERACNALLVLNQGWANHVGILELEERGGKDVKQAEKIATDLERFAERRVDHALMAEGLCPGIGKKMAAIYQATRMLRATAVQAQVSGHSEYEVWNDAAEVIALVKALQREIGGFLLTWSQ